MNSVSLFAGRFLAFAAGAIILLSCQKKTDAVAPDDDSPSPATVVKNLVRTMADPGVSNGTVSGVEPEAEIVDIVDGGNGGEWAAIIKFPKGLSSACAVEVVNKAGELLARDEINPSGSGDVISHNVRFGYNGSIESLRVQVRDQESGAVIAEFPDP